VRDLRLLPELPLLRRELSELSARRTTYVIRVLSAVVIVAGVITMEKERKTLGLLFVTRPSPADDCAGEAWQSFVADADAVADHFSDAGICIFAGWFGLALAAGDILAAVPGVSVVVRQSSVLWIAGVVCVSAGACGAGFRRAAGAGGCCIELGFSADVFDSLVGIESCVQSAGAVGFRGGP
jgi:hypothetical protein